MFTKFTKRLLITPAYRKISMTTAQPVRGFASGGLSPETVKVVKATAPVLAQYGYQITRTMYKKMLGGNAEVKALFNPTHQLELDGQKARQPWTLASAVHAYAENIDNLGALSEAVERIAQKHVSLYVLPEHYPIVGENLLWAIKEVLGDAATPQIMEAWKEAYLFLADIFIQRERQLREQKAQEEGGWEGWRKFVVDRKVKESDEITSFYLRPKDNGPLPSFYPGQYTAVRMELPGVTTQRNYSLSIAPGRPQLRITVKKEQPLHPGCPVGHISNHLHNNVKEGDELLLGVPCGDFFLKLDHDKPIVLISGGVGVTPITSMLEYLVDTKAKNKVEVITAARNPQVEAMHNVFAKHAEDHPNVRVMTLYDSGSSDFRKGPISSSLLDQLVSNKDSHFYFCGPEGFMRTVYRTLLNWKVPANQIHFEFFGPHDDLLRNKL